MTTDETTAVPGDGDDVTSLSASELLVLLDKRELSSVEAIGRFVARIEAVEGGPSSLRAVYEVSPDVLEQAAERDRERAAGHIRGPLHGLPVLLKDNIDTVAPLHTTAGSLVFGDASPAADAPLVTALREAGAIVLGKASLSEWANFRSRPSSSGWSARGGQTRNPHALDRSPGGSSSGSGAALAARLTPLAVGTETDGSILCPAALCGVVGLKPTVGLVARTGVVPIACSQDTAGPMARTVEDVALLLGALAGASGVGEPGVDLDRPENLPLDYRALLGDGNLHGLRIGVLRDGGFSGYHARTDALFAVAVDALREAGATVRDPVSIDGAQAGEPAHGPLVSSEDEHIVLINEFRTTAESYFARRRSGPSGVNGSLPVSLDDVIRHIEGEPGERMDLFGVELIAQAAATSESDRAHYERALADNRRRARRDGIDRLLAENEIDLIATVSSAPAWLIDHVLGDLCPGSGWGPPAVAGYPSATLPIGLVAGLPVGITLWAPAYGEASLLRAMFGLERALGSDVTAPVPGFVPVSSTASV